MTQVVVCRIKFQSVASPPKRDGKLLPGVMRVPLRAPFGSFFFTVRGLVGGCYGEGCTSPHRFYPGWVASRWQRVVRNSRCTFNLGGAFGLHSLIRAPHHACKQAARVFRVLFSPAPFVMLSHAHKHGERNVGSIRNSVGEIQNVEC